MSILTDASLIITPNAYKEGSLLAVVPSNGNGDLTWTRNSGATRVNSAGLIENVLTNVPRLDYSLGSCPNILIEPQRTNRLLNSETLVTQSISTTGLACAVSFYGTGTITFSGTFTGTLVGTGANNRVSTVFTPTTGTLTLTVSGSVTKAQAETGAFPTSYIPTTSATVTRVADVAGKTGISSLIGQTEGTIFLDVNVSKFIQNSARIFIDVISTNDANRIYIDMPSTINGNSIQTAIRANSIFQVVSQSKTISLGRIKLGIAYKSGNCAFYINGESINFTTNNAFTFNSNLDLIRLGIRGNADTSILSDSINSALIFPTRLTNTQLQQLTTL